MNISTLAAFSNSMGLALARFVGSNPQAQLPAGLYGELLESRLMPDYHALVKAGKVYTASGTAANPSAFTGAAAGTPLLGIYNPAGSNVDIVPIMLTASVRTTGTAAVADDFNFWMANQGTTPVTGTNTPPKNLYSQVAAGSVSTCMINTANTAALASTLVKGSFSVGLTGATAAPDVILLQDELKGLLIVSPGNYLAWGAAAGFTAASIDFSMIWAEVSV